VAKHSNIIEMNGRRYDAISGALLDGPSARAGADIRSSDTAITDLRPAKQSLKPIAKKPIMDGFVRTGAKTTAAQLHAQPSRSKTLKRNATHTKAVKAAVVAKDASRPAITTSKPQTAHEPTKSQTLMRHAVTKPVIERKPLIKAQPHTATLVTTPPKGLVRKKMSDVVDTHRSQRASGTPKHGKVSRFHKEKRLLPEVLPIHVPVTPAPIAVPALIAPTVAKPAVVDIFDQALQAARSHEQTYTPPKRRRVPTKSLSAVAVSVAVLLLVGWLGVVNKSSIEMQMASAQAGFKADIPAYTPAGFAYTDLDRAPGEVAINYHAVAQEAGYTIFQKPSAWDSQTLLDAYVSNLKDTYNVYQKSGRSIYVYGSNATWVSNGIWYEIQTKGHGLTQEQLLDIAVSL